MRIALLFLAACGVESADLRQVTSEQVVSPGAAPSVAIPIDLALPMQIAAPDDAVTLASLSLSITKTDEPIGDHDDWRFISSLHVFVQSADLPKQEIAYAVNPQDSQTLDFAVDSSIDLRPYTHVSAEAIGIAPTDNVSYLANAAFNVQPR